MPAASAALASVEAATSSSGRPSSSRTRRTVASSGWRRSSRPAGRLPTSSISSVSGGSTVSTCNARPKRASSVSSSARCSITSSAWAAIALTAVPPWIRPMFVLASPRGCRLSVRAMRHTSSIALGRPRLAQEWPPGPRTVMRARRLPTPSTATCERPWPSSASTWSGCRVSHAERAPARLPRPSSPTVNATATPSAAPCWASCSTTWTAHTTAAALSPIPGPRTRSPSICGSCGTSRREDGVHVREQEHPRPGSVEGPDQVAGRVDDRAAGRRRRAAAAATRCARPRRTSERERAPARSGRQGHRPRRSRRADAIRPPGVPTGRRPSAHGTRPRPRSPRRR